MLQPFIINEIIYSPSYLPRKGKHGRLSNPCLVFDKKRYYIAKYASDSRKWHDEYSEEELHDLLYWIAIPPI